MSAKIIYTKGMRNTQYIKAEDWVIIAEQIASKHDGVLPNPQALIDDGYWALYKQMRRNTKLFAHIPQVKKITPKPKHKKSSRRMAVCA